MLCSLQGTPQLPFKIKTGAPAVVQLDPALTVSWERWGVGSGPGLAWWVWYCCSFGLVCGCGSNLISGLGAPHAIEWPQK